MHPLRKKLGEVRDSCIDEAHQAQESGDAQKAWLWKQAGQFVVDAIRALKRVEHYNETKL